MRIAFIPAAAPWISPLRCRPGACRAQSRLKGAPGDAVRGTGHQLRLILRHPTRLPPRGVPLPCCPPLPLLPGFPCSPWLPLFPLALPVPVLSLRPLPAVLAVLALLSLPRCSRRALCSRCFPCPAALGARRARAAFPAPLLSGRAALALLSLPRCSRGAPRSPCSPCPAALGARRARPALPAPLLSGRAVLALLSLPRCSRGAPRSPCSPCSPPMPGPPHFPPVQDRPLQARLADAGAVLSDRQTLYSASALQL